MVVATEAGFTSVAVSPAEVFAVEALRETAYRRASEFNVIDKRAYIWTQADNRGHVLAVWDGAGQALATMRGIVAVNRSDAETQLECTVALEPNSFPTLILEKAATASQCAKQGLNSLLRFHFIESAYRCNLLSLVGAVFEGAPRLGVLAEIGYDFVPADRMWDPNFAKYSAVQVVALRRVRMQSASALLKGRFASSLERYPWRGETAQLAPSVVSRAPKAFDASA